MIRRRGRLGTVTISPQIRHYHGIILCQPWRKQMPHYMGLRMSVEQKQWRASSSITHINLRFASVNCRGLKIFKQHSFSPFFLILPFPSKRLSEPLCKYVFVMVKGVVSKQTKRIYFPDRGRRSGPEKGSARIDCSCHWSFERFWPGHCPAVGSGWRQCDAGGQADRLD